VTYAALGKIVLALLIFDGFLTFVLEVLFLPTYIGGHAFPVAALIAGVINVALILLAREVTDRLLLLSLPLVAWLIGFVVGLSSGPGADVLLLMNWATLLLFAGGLLPPAALLYKLAQHPSVR